jgi:hypothetical protein
VDEDLWLADGLEDLILGVAGAPAAPAVGDVGAPARRIRPGAYTIRPPAGKSEEEIVFQLVRDATNAPVAEMKRKEDIYAQRVQSVNVAGRISQIQRLMAPQPEERMSQKDKEKLQQRGALQRLEAMSRRQREQDEMAKKVAMHAKMAKVRAAKRKTGKR